jgi:hypothetical protein
MGRKTTMSCSVGWVELNWVLRTDDLNVCKLMVMCMLHVYAVCWMLNVFVSSCVCFMYLYLYLCVEWTNRCIYTCTIHRSGEHDEKADKNNIHAVNISISNSCTEWNEMEWNPMDGIHVMSCDAMWCDVMWWNWMEWIILRHMSTYWYSIYVSA